MIEKKDIVGLLLLPIGIIILYISYEHLRLIDPYVAFVICMFSLMLIFVGIAELFWIIGITKDIEVNKKLDDYIKH